MIGNIGESRRRVIAEFKADTSGYEAGVARMKQSAGSWGESMRESTGIGLEGLAKRTVGIAALKGGIELADKAFETWGRTARLQAATATLNIEKLKSAFSGLLDENEVREFAAKTMNGALKLSEDQMGTL